MALLQDPVKALDQAEWYLANTALEKFPGAFELAAGNLCRQTLEQALFILCFYSQMPRQQFVRPDRTLKTAGILLRQLDAICPTTGTTFWDITRQSRKRIAKFAKVKRSIQRWARELNEPSHFSLRFRKLRKDSYESFIIFARGLFDPSDRLLIIAAINELFSRGTLWVVLDQKDQPVLYRREVIRMKDFNFESGRLSVSGRKRPFLVIPNDEIPRGRWPLMIVLPLGCVGIGIGVQMVTPKGDPVDLSSFAQTIASFSQSPSQRAALRRRFKQLGLDLEYTGAT